MDSAGTTSDGQAPRLGKRGCGGCQRHARRSAPEALAKRRPSKARRSSSTRRIRRAGRPVQLPAAPARSRAALSRAVPARGRQAPAGRPHRDRPRAARPRTALPQCGPGLMRPGLVDGTALYGAASGRLSSISTTSCRTGSRGPDYAVPAFHAGRLNKCRWRAPRAQHAVGAQPGCQAIAHAPSASSDTSTRPLPWPGRHGDGVRPRVQVAEREQRSTSHPPAHAPKVATHIPVGSVPSDHGPATLIGYPPQQNELPAKGRSNSRAANTSKT